MKLFLTFALFISAITYVNAQVDQISGKSSESVILEDGGNSPVILYDTREISQAELSAMDQKDIGSIEILNGEEAGSRFGKYMDYGAIVISSQKDVPVKTETPSFKSSSAPSEKISSPKSDEVKMSFGSDLNAYILIDGQPSTMAILQNLKPEQIETMQVIKREAAVEKYGEVAKEGDIEVTTRQ